MNDKMSELGGMENVWRCNEFIDRRDILIIEGMVIMIKIMINLYKTEDI